LGDKKTEENKRKALEALDSRGSRHDAATAADVSLKTLMEWRRRDDRFAAEWDATIERVMTRLWEQPLDDKGNFKRSPVQYGLKATDENKEICWRCWPAAPPTVQQPLRSALIAAPSSNGPTTTRNLLSAGVTTAAGSHHRSGRCASP
jgi:hypothetical protein